MGGFAYGLIVIGYVLNNLLTFLFGSELDEFLVNSIFKAKDHPPPDKDDQIQRSRFDKSVDVIQSRKPLDLNKFDRIIGRNELRRGKVLARGKARITK